MKLTGERVVTAGGRFNPTWQRHVAAYSLADGFLPQGRLLDVGCGIGHSYHLLAPRVTVGLDISAEALEGQDRETVEADMRELPFEDGEFASVLSVQSLEHVPDPERVVAEVARVLEPGGTAMFVTPNRLTLGRPDEIIDPYHFREFDHAELADLCRQHFESVRDPRSVRFAALHGDRPRGAGQARPPPAQGPAPPAPLGAGPHQAEALRRTAQPAPRHARPAGPGDRGRRLRAARRPTCWKPSTSARSASERRRDQPRTEAHGARLRLVRRPLRRPGRPPPPPHALRRPAGRPPPIHRPPRRSWPRPTATGTGPTNSAASTSRPTRSSAAPAACRRRGSTRSRQRDRCSTSGPATAR